MAVALGWVGIVALPELWDHVGADGIALLGAGGALYTAGAVGYALRRPDPVPSIFGYHELFHALVIAAARVSVRGGRAVRSGVDPGNRAFRPSPGLGFPDPEPP